MHGNIHWFLKMYDVVWKSVLNLIFTEPSENYERRERWTLYQLIHLSRTCPIFSVWKSNYQGVSIFNIYLRFVCVG